ncbi:MAG: TonB-dependent receptor, partial [Gammaproteobacteria bacterium]|nr:TonB-dependent receptor [Gammaproteobacteria bacterium]
FITGPLAYKDLATRFSNPNPEAFRKAGSRRASLRWSPAETGAWRHEWRAYARNSDMDFLQHFLPGQPLEENGQTSGGLLYTARTAIAEDGELALGIDTELARGYLKETQENPATGSPFIVATRPVGKHYDYRVNSGLLAAYSNLRLPLTQRLEMQAGVRAEYLRYDYDNKMVSGNTQDDGVTPCGFGGCQYARPEDRQDNFRNIAPNLGLSFRLDEANTLFASARRGFRAPQSTELYRLQRGQMIADIRTEKLNALEVGWRHRTDTLAVELTAYLMRKKNFIFRDATDANVSDGRTRHAGVELSADWQPGENWYLGITGSHAKQEYRFTRSADLGEEIARGNDIDTAPRTLASARLGYAYSRGRAEIEWAYTDSYFTDAANTTRYEGHQLLNLRVLFDISRTLTAGLRLNNLTDEVYADRADLLAVTSPPTERYFPGHPREIYVSIAWRQ